ncbi:putative sodium-coupled neutral amino acid transporter 10 isoform 1 [Schistosoma japonicum]|uniref:Putative sodium-coupled neutral amino acid transporter 10 isoform 1 n=1 Tax=Schistosoma japonicum TaxID=6182 RepID=A0A4Z2CMV0_SCHJA|nr:putative sodium-coupled neutral amino acid transporter 10 isoform 1 [Schistosoma japonicum]
MSPKLYRSVNRYFYSQDEMVTMIGPIITLINNTVGVAALAMPFCFHQCGILLSFLFLGITAAFSIMSCDALIDICSAHRILPFEHACFKALGHTGKSLAELSVAGLLFGYVVGYYVTIADLSTGVVSQVAESIMIFILGLPRLISNMPWEEMNWWKPAGLIECIPIFLASMFCQTQLHVSLTRCCQPTPSNMRLVVRVALATVAVVYGFFGFFGYVAFINSQRTAFSGNVFLMYPDDFRSFCMRIGFLLTNIVSIPLIMFPLRQTVFSLLCQRRLISFGVNLEVDSAPLISEEIPRRYVQNITISLILASFLLSLTTDKIEVIIRFTTNIAGSMTGFILPALVLLVASATAISAKNNISSNGSIQRFLQFSRNHSAAYCLLLVGCLLFSLEFMSIHNESNNTIISNNLHHVDTIPPLGNVVRNAEIIKPFNITMKNPLLPIDLSKIPSHLSIQQKKQDNNNIANLPLISHNNVQSRPTSVWNNETLHLRTIHNNSNSTRTSSNLHIIVTKSKIPN